MTTADYWHRLPPFARVTTYSFNRDPRLRQLIEQARAELQTARYVRRPALQQQLEHLENRRDVPLLSAENGLDPTAVQVAGFGAREAATQQLRAILTTPVALSMVAGCRPIFRDALVFHAAPGHILSVLNICFQCRYLQNEAGEFIEADTTVYEQLQQFLLALGHPIDSAADARQAEPGADLHLL